MMIDRNHITTFIYKGPLNSSQMYHLSKVAKHNHIT
jgi:hypothetical protein